jgi:Na+-translocating ferredoxin:NAD+ oxidoreductase RnfC subunit
MAPVTTSKLSDAARVAGVVGGGGAGFPTHVKVQSRAEIVIANGAECEPLLRVDQQLMALEAEKLVESLLKVRESTGAKRAVIGLKEKYKEARKALEPFAKKAGVELFGLGAFYPAGDEVTLVYEVTGRVIPEGALPLSVGCLVQNIHTLLWLDDAAAGVPVTMRTLTVGGAVRNPVTVRAPVGTLVEDLIDCAGGPTSDEFAVIDGGPMMGKFVTPLTSITKRTSGLVVFPSDHPYVLKRSEHVKVSWRRAASACTVCEDCTKYCPRYLLGHRVLPHRAMRQAAMTPMTEAGMTENPPLAGYALSGAICCECGICTLWSCPMDLRPREMMQMVKRKMMQTKTTNPFKGKDGPIHPGYDDRKIPVDRLIKGLYLTDWDVPAPLRGEPLRPARVRIPLAQHIGAPAVAAVKPGQSVRAGDVVGEAVENALGARVHASIDGVVVSVDDHVEIRRG